MRARSAAIGRCGGAFDASGTLPPSATACLPQLLSLGTQLRESTQVGGAGQLQELGSRAREHFCWVQRVATERCDGTGSKGSAGATGLEERAGSHKTRSVRRRDSDSGSHRLALCCTPVEPAAPLIRAISSASLFFDSGKNTTGTMAKLLAADTAGGQVYKAYELSNYALAGKSVPGCRHHCACQSLPGAPL